MTAPNAESVRLRALLERTLPFVASEANAPEEHLSDRQMEGVEDARELLSDIRDALRAPVQVDGSGAAR